MTLQKESPDAFKKIITLGIYGHEFLIKDVKKLAKVYACTHSKRVLRKRSISNTTSKQKSVGQLSGCRPRRQHTRERFTAKTGIQRQRFVG